MIMAEAPKPPGVIRFPGARSGIPKLSLPRRRPAVSTRSPFEISEASAEARKQIHDIVSVTRASLAEPVRLNDSQAAELEKSLRILEMKLAERERVVAELESRCADRERELAEMEAVLLAREKLVAASRSDGPKAELSVAEKEALEQLRVELSRQEESLRGAMEALKEREAFLDEAESRLFEKVQAQQEKETELEQREEDLRKRERQVREREAVHDPEVAAALKSEAAARKFDEFSE